MTASIPLLVFFVVLNGVEKDFYEFLLCLTALIVVMVGARRSGTERQRGRFSGFCFGLLSIVLLIGVALKAGEGTVLYWAYAAPPLYFAVFGVRKGLYWAVWMFALMTGIVLLPNLFISDWYPYAVSVRFLIVFGFTLILSYGTEATRSYLVQQWHEERVTLLKKKKSLESALAELKMLGGLLPICTKCKKIRNENGDWQDIAGYIKENSEADFSHGICPRCADLLYSDTIPKSS